MTEPIRAVQVGCGPIGCNIARLASSRSSIDIVGAVDPAFAGRNMAELVDDGSLNGLTISEDASATIEQSKPDIVLHATGSSLKQVLPQLEQILEFGVNIVSTCEELSYPFYHHPELSRRLDNRAREHGVTVLASGVNPGFVMDVWPVFMTGISQNVDSIICVRELNAAHRRLPFQRKIGAGLSVKEFYSQVESGRIRHVGLPESAAMIAAGLGWQLDAVDETIEPVVADEKVSSESLCVAAGQVAGVKQVAKCVVAGDEVIRLEFSACIGAENPHDAVYIKGLPDMQVVITGGVHGDLATASAVVNVVPRAVSAPAGLKTMIDIPPIAPFG